MSNLSIYEDENYYYVNDGSKNSKVIIYLIILIPLIALGLFIWGLT